MGTPIEAEKSTETFPMKNTTARGFKTNRQVHTQQSQYTRDQNEPITNKHLDAMDT